MSNDAAGGEIPVSEGIAEREVETVVEDFGCLLNPNYKKPPQTKLSRRFFADYPIQ